MLGNSQPYLSSPLRVGDYFENEKRWWLRLHEKGGKRHEVSCHHALGKFLDDWLGAAGVLTAPTGRS